MVGEILRFGDDGWRNFKIWDDFLYYEMVRRLFCLKICGKKKGLEREMGFVFSRFLEFLVGVCVIYVLVLCYFIVYYKCEVCIRRLRDLILRLLFVLILVKVVGVILDMCLYVNGCCLRFLVVFILIYSLFDFFFFYRRG